MYLIPFFLFYPSISTLLFLFFYSVDLQKCVCRAHTAMDGLIAYQLCLPAGSQLRVILPSGDIRQYPEIFLFLQLNSRGLLLSGLGLLLLFIINFYSLISVLVYMWRSEDNLWKSVLSFHPLGPRNQTQIVRFGCKWLNSVSRGFPAS